MNFNWFWVQKIHLRFLSGAYYNNYISTAKSTGFLILLVVFNLFKKSYFLLRLRLFTQIAAWVTCAMLNWPLSLNNLICLTNRLTVLLPQSISIRLMTHSLLLKLTLFGRVDHISGSRWQLSTAYRGLLVLALRRWLHAEWVVLWRVADLAESFYGQSTYLGQIKALECEKWFPLSVDSVFQIFVVVDGTCAAKLIITLPLGLHGWGELGRRARSEELLVLGVGQE